MSELLRAESIGRQTQTGAWLIQNVSLQIATSERWAIVGPTGSGKTVLMRMLALLDPPTTGRILWKGTEPHGSQIPLFRRQAIYLGQRPAFSPGAVLDSLQRVFELQAAGNQKFDRGAVEKMLAEVGWPSDFLSKNTSDLSGGERQVASLIRALQLNPELLMLDEPTAALDSQTAAKIEQIVAHWVEQDPARSTLWVTHDGAQRQRVADQFFELPGAD